MTPTDLNALIGSRICHDLISPLGAIGNGIELLTLSGFGAAPEIALISESVENANARIRFFRIAFGTAGDAAKIGQNEVQGILRDMYRGGRIKIDWRAEGDQSRAEVKLAFLLIQCLESAMPWGGQIRVAHHGTSWNVEGRAERIKADPRLWGLVSDAPAASDIGASEVHFALVGGAARQARRNLATFRSETQITVSF